jgi:hypothetical protein
VAQAAEQPSLDDQHRDFDFRLVTRPARPCRQDRGVVMGRHFGVGPIDLRLVEAGLDDSDFGVVRHQQLGYAPERGESSGVGTDPVGQRLAPARLGIGEIGGAHDRDENLRRTDLTGEPVDDHRHRVAGVIDEQLVAADVGLPHRDREPRRPTAVQLAKARIAISFGAAFDVLVPQHRQGDVLALELAVNLSPIGFDMTPMALLGASRREQRRLQRCIRHLCRQWPAQPGTRQSLQRQPDSRRRNADSAGNLVEPDPRGPQTKHFAHLAHHCPLCWHPLPRANAKGADPNRASRGPALTERHHPGMAGEIISERRARSNRNAGRHHRGFAGDFPRNPQRAVGRRLPLQLRDAGAGAVFVLLAGATADPAGALDDAIAYDRNRSLRHDHVAALRRRKPARCWHVGTLCHFAAGAADTPSRCRTLSREVSSDRCVTRAWLVSMRRDRGLV